MGTKVRRGLPFLFLVAYVLVIGIITIPLYNIFIAKQKHETLKQNLELLMDGLEDYADAYGNFPDDIVEIINDGQIINFPNNPYHNRLMKPRDVGSPFSGDFSYIPVFNDRGVAMACMLVGYGPDLESGKDIFTVGNDYTRLMKFSPEPDGIPDGVVIVLQSRRGNIQA